MTTQRYLIPLLGLCFLLSLSVAGEPVPCLALERLARNVTKPNQWATQHTPRSAVELLREHRAAIRSGAKQKPEELPLKHAGLNVNRSLQTHYNPAGWFDTTIDGKPTRVWADRSESLRSETDTQVAFSIAGKDGELVPLKAEGVPTLKLQDPFITTVGNELILGGVQVKVNDKGHVTGYSTTFRRDRGKGLQHLEPFLDGPPGMKDIRLRELPDKRVLFFTRPQGRRKGGRGQVGVGIAESLDAITPKMIQDAPVLKGQFLEEEWGGVNAAYNLKNGLVGLLGHTARWEGNRRQYYAVAWAYNPKTGEFTPNKIILERSDLPGGLNRGHKREDLKNVIFPGQLIRNYDGTAILNGGEGDKRIFSALIEDPFLEYER